MSVINQMLKDLDKRQAGQQGEAGAVNLPTPTVGQSGKQVSVIVVISILVTLSGVFFWQQHLENKALKLKIKNNDVSQASTLRVSQETKKTVVKTVEDQGIESNPVDPKSIVAKETNAKQKPNTAALASTDAPVEFSQSDIDKQTTKTVQAPQVKQAENIVEDESEQLNLVKDNAEQKTVETTTSNKPSLAISRHHLTPEELSAEKMSRAKIALSENELSKAETMFEDVLLILPRHKDARKQLAALWFGRKDYKAAVNLLSQGISISPQESDYRLMQARIYLQQGLNFQALNTLQGLPDTPQVEYQSLLASIAQQLAQLPTAIYAYKILVQLQPNIGRWSLGLAVAYDSDSQFKLAKVAYENALAQRNLSEKSKQFALNRLTEIGE